MEQLIDILKYYLDFTDLDAIIDATEVLPEGCIGHTIERLSKDFEFSSLSNFHFGLVGVGENRNTENTETSQAPDKIRTSLYRLFPVNSRMRLIDLGNLKKAKTANDTYFALRDLIEAMVENRIIPIIIGGGQDLTYAQFKAYKNIGDQVNLTAIDSFIDLGDISTPFHARSYVGKILTEDGKQLFNFANLCSQQYLVSPTHLDMMEKLFFDICSVGEIQQNIENAEPIIRDSHLVSFDISAVRHSEAPGTKYSSPNGLYGNEACQLAWYSGISENVSSFGLYEYNPVFDDREMTSALAAQIIWHFIDGYYHRMNDFPIFDDSKHELLKYDVNVLEHKVQFIYSKSSGRWWMKIPMMPDKKGDEMIIACNYEDYSLACEGEVPDRLWRIYQKIN